MVEELVDVLAVAAERSASRGNLVALNEY